jgi:hypothetical protein
MARLPLGAAAHPSIFPLPPIPLPTRPDSRSRRVLSRHSVLCVSVQLANRAIVSLNTLYSSTSPSHTASILPSVVPSSAQRRHQTFVLRATVAFVRRRGHHPQCGDDAAALASLLGSFQHFDTYMGVRPPAKVVPLNVDTLSLPSVPPRLSLLDALPPDLRAKYSSPRLLLRPDPPPRQRRPFIGGTFSEFEAVMVRLFQLGLVAPSARPLGLCGGFAVAKSGGKSRWIVDCRQINDLMVPPDKVALSSSDRLVNLCSSTPFYIGGADIKNYYYNILLEGEWANVFGFPAIRTTALGLPVHQYGEWVHLCLRVLPMGWSHSVLLAQAIHTRLLHQFADLPPHRSLDALSDLDISNGAHNIYIDDLSLFHPRAETVNSALARACDTYTTHHLPPNLEKVFRATQRAEVLGLEVDGHELRVSLSAEKASRLVSATRHLLRIGVCSGFLLASVVGHWTWAMLVRRPSLSVFSAVYRFIAKFGGKVRPLWRSVRRELRTAMGLMPLLTASIRDTWFSQAIAVDASSTGAGVCATPAPPSLLRQEAARAPVSGAPVRLDGGVQGEDLGDLRVFGLPSDLHHARWSTIVSSKWRWPSHINLLEVEAALLGIRWTLSHPDSLGRRVVIYSDSRVAVGALTKGRSSSFPLLRLLRRVAAHVLSSGIQVYYRWLPSGDNPADGPSRQP